MGRIRLLDQRLINQIAAGEVVERPCSVVKELVENALDAEARQVTVEIERGGTRLIRVWDDGTGMGRDDALLCFERHATSKLRDEGDLYAVTTLGFRGEALSSIAAVSRVELVTAEPDAPVGTRVVVAAGVVERVEDASRPPGTTVTVRHLFFNVPVRRGFLRSVESETRAVVDTVMRLAWARPQCGFRMVVDGREVWHVPPVDDLRTRLFQLLGSQRAERLVAIQALSPGVAVEGFVGHEPGTRASARHQVFVINGRPADSPVIRAALAEALQPGQSGGRPEAYLHLQVEPSLVDVNVHPTKREVRFREPHRIHACLKAALRQGAPQPAATVSSGPVQVVTEWGKPSHGVAEQVTLWGQPPGQKAPRDAMAEIPLFQVARAYIVTVLGEVLTVFDQHACHERVMYEEALRRLSGAQGPAQQLLFPLVLEVSPTELALAEEFQDELRQVGFEIRPFGKSAVVVEAAPADVTDVTEELVRNVLQGLGEESGALAPRHHRVASSVACHASIKAGQALTPPQMRALIDHLLATETPHACPHGRPTFVQITVEELQRRFHRT